MKYIFDKIKSVKKFYSECKEILQFEILYLITKRMVKVFQYFYYKILLFLLLFKRKVVFLQKIHKF